MPLLIRKSELWKSAGKQIYIPLCLYLYLWWNIRPSFCTYLHSTMPLLIRRAGEGSELLCVFTFHYASTYTEENLYWCTWQNQFTFHYASTYTAHWQYPERVDKYLHSTMPLLILRSFISYTSCPFNLHSTMPLLIPFRQYSISRSIRFTFHYASTYT